MPPLDFGRKQEFQTFTTGITNKIDLNNVDHRLSCRITYLFHVSSDSFEDGQFFKYRYVCDWGAVYRMNKC